MISIIAAINLAASLLTIPNAKFNYLYSNLDSEEQNVVLSNNIDSDEKLDKYTNDINTNVLSHFDNGHSESYLDCYGHLTDCLSDYDWKKENSNTTSYTTYGVPINMQGEAFPKSEIRIAINNTKVKSDYGGCGPIAMMGIFDYFSRYLGYKEYIENVNSSEDRISLAEMVLRKSKTFEVGFGDKQTLMYPWDYESAFNKISKDCGLKGVIGSKHHFKLFGGHKSKNWKIIKENIDKGLPVTLMTGLFSGSGDFAKHYTNIYGYEQWIGYSKIDGHTIEKNFILGRLNWPGCDNGFYCNSEILNDGMIALITYDIKYKNSYGVTASDFKNDFVNENGQGQYFYNDVQSTITTEDGHILNTNRKRCSYIENQYLVLSPIRENAGIAYLEIEVPHALSKISFKSALWSSNESILMEEFKIQYYLDEWIDHVSFKLSDFSTVKKYPDEYTFILPKNALKFRFIATKENPWGTRNKGRIILDNIVFEYN